MASELDIFGHTVATSSQRKKKKKMSFERRFVLYALLASLFPLGVCELMLWLGSFSSQTQWTLTFFLVLAWLIGAFALRAQIVRPLQTLSNMVAALREEDFSFRARRASRNDALGELVLEINALSDTLQGQRLGSMEAVALLKKVLMEIEQQMIHNLIERAQSARRAHNPDELPRTGRALGDSTDFISRTWRPASTSVDFRSQSRASRRRTAGVAAAHPSAWTRIEQLTGTHKVNRGHVAFLGIAPQSSGGLESGRGTWPRGNREPG